MLKDVQYLILGAGPCGLGAGIKLQELGISDYLICEKLNHPGGLATSYLDENGFTWDIGGHVQFSHYPYFDRIMDRAISPENWLHHQRESWVWLQNRFIPYPFQYNIHRLDPTQIKQIAAEIQQQNNADDSPPSQNFRQWLEKQFGPTMCRIFMWPYNFKVWAHPLEQMNAHWIAERVATIDQERFFQNLEQQKDDVSWGPNATFRFPKEGGTGAIWENVAKMLPQDNIQYQSELTSIDPINKVACFNHGAMKVKYQQLISSLPIPKLIETIDIDEVNFSEEKSFFKNLLAQAKQLKYSSSHIVGIGIEGQAKPELKSKCWMYFPEDNCPFYRVTLFSKYSPLNVPDASRQFSLMTETSESSHRPVDQQNLVQRTIDGLSETNLIGKKDKIVSTWQFKAGYGYPTPGLERDRILQDVLPQLSQYDIYSRGRFGAWKYEISNQDHTFMQGVEVIDFLENNIDETTFSLSV